MLRLSLIYYDERFVDIGIDYDPGGLVTGD